MILGKIGGFQGKFGIFDAESRAKFGAIWLKLGCPEWIL